MAGLFEFMAADEGEKRVASRKAIAVARRRFSTRFAPFLSDFEGDELAARREVIEPEVREMLQEVADEYGVDADALHSATAGVVQAARRPKMCPYHRDVVDISLATGDPQGGFNALAQHAYGEKSCRGGFDDRCNFKPEMVTQSFWDQRAEQAEERKQQRQQLLEQDAPTHEEAEAPVEPVADVPEAHDGELVDDAPVELWASPDPAEAMLVAAARTARHVAAYVEQPVLHPAVWPHLDTIERNVPGVRVNDMPYHDYKASALGIPAMEHGPVNINHPDPDWERVTAGVMATGGPGPIAEEMERRQAIRQQKQQVASVKEAEALKTIDVEEPVGPSPKLDKRRWSPENVKFLDTEMEGSPVPTRHEDIMEPTDYSRTNPNDPFSDDHRLDQTGEATTEHQDVTKGTEHGQVPSVVKDNSAWSQSNGANPVTGSTKEAYGGHDEYDRDPNEHDPWGDSGYGDSERDHHMTDLQRSEGPQAEDGACPGCGTDVHESHNFCPGCGSPVRHEFVPQESSPLDHAPSEGPAHQQVPEDLR